MKILLAVLAIGILAAVWAFGIEPKLLKTVSYKARLPGLEGMRIVWATDFHAAPGDKERLKQIVQVINAQKPDLILLGGDFVKGHKKESTLPMAKIAQILGGLKAKYGVYSVLGNHDWLIDGNDMRQELEKQGIAVLENENRAVMIGGQQLFLAGVADYTMRQPDLKKSLDKTENPLILMTHNPDIFPEVPAKVNLTLAGHVHGGQVSIPLIGPLLVPSVYWRRYAGGKVIEDGRTMIVSKGIGTSLLPLRFNCPPEIVVVEIK